MYWYLYKTPEQASAAYVPMRKDRDEAKASKLGVDEVNVTFDAFKKRRRRGPGNDVPGIGLIIMYRQTIQV